MGVSPRPAPALVVTEGSVVVGTGQQAQLHASLPSLVFPGAEDPTCADVRRGRHRKRRRMGDEAILCMG